MEPKTYQWIAGSGRCLYLTLTMEDAQTGHHQGRCDDDIEWLTGLDRIATQVEAWEPGTLRDELREYGAWDGAELADHEANIQRMVWIACGDVSENPEFYEVENV